MESVYRITLDTQAAGSQISLQCTHGDSGRVIEITLTENGNPFVPPSGAYAVFMAHKADGHIIYNNADIDGDKIIYAITAQTTAAVGVSGCEIRVYDASGAVITSARFDMLIDEPVYDDIQIQSTDEYIALADLVAQILDLIMEYGESVKKVNGKVPDVSGSVVINSNDILMSTGRHEDFSDEPITDVVDQLGMRIDAAQNTANSAKTSADAAVKKVNGRSPTSGNVIVYGEEVRTQQSEWDYNGSVTGAIDEAYEHADEAMTSAIAAKSTADTAQITAENSQTTANAARTLAVTAVRSVNSKTPTGGNVELRSNDIKMDAGDYEDYSEESITDVVDQLGERIDAAKSTAEAAQSAANSAVKRVNSKSPTLGDVVIGSNDIYMDAGIYEDYSGYTITEAVDDLVREINGKGGKVELVRSGDRILRNGQAMTFRGLRELLTVHPDFVYLLDGDWAFLTTFIYGQPTDAYQYIRFSSTVIGDLKTKTSSVVVQTTNGGTSYTVSSSTINNENVSNKSADMSVLNDTRYPTTKAVSDYVNSKLAEIPFAEGVVFGG